MSKTISVKPLYAALRNTLPASLVLVWLLYSSFLQAQSGFRRLECETEVGYYYGKPGQVVHGYCLAPKPAKDGFYLGGFLNDSALIAELDLMGRIIWARTLDVVQDREDHISAIFVDSDGMLGIAGTGGFVGSGQGGSIFVFRYNPVSHQVLWTKEFTPAWTRSYCWTMIEKRPGGNYLISNNPVDDPNFNVDAELFEINRSNGSVAPGIFKNYNHSGSEDITSMLIHEGFLYGTGRFSWGGTPETFRQSLIKIDISSGDVNWAKVGHQTQNGNARLYGVDLLIANNFIYHCYEGDPSGTSTTNTKFYVQKTDLNGSISWLKQYELPGTNDWGYEMITSGNGIVILAAQRAAPRAYILYKIDFDGNLVWAKSLPMANPIYTAHGLIGDNQLIELQGQLIFIGYETLSASEAKMIVYRADLEGNPISACSNISTINITVTNINFPSFQSMNMIVTDPDFNERQHTKTSHAAHIPYDPDCVQNDTIFNIVTESICTGETYEGYTASGTYEDYFLTQQGCDSVRILQLTVTTPLLTFINATFCEGETFLGYDQTGIYVDTFQSIDGCDSIRTLDLTIEPTFTTDQTISLCEGEIHEGYSQSGTYIDTFVAVNGCDSFRTLLLIVNPTYATSIHQTACNGQSVEGYTVSGVYTDNFQSIDGCDSTRILELTVSDFLSTIIDARICEGEILEGYSESGAYIDTFASSFGCDSIRFINLEVEEIYITPVTFSICDELAKGISSPGVYADTLFASAGCDSILILNVQDLALYIPNVFSPNDDGINDVFTLYPFPEQELNLQYFAIFDRFGNMAYETSSWPIEWKGISGKGRKYQPGVFAYNFIYTCGDETKIQKGNITLLK